MKYKEVIKMALDGISISALVHELNTTLSGGRFFKIAQPEKDELQITIKQARDQYRLLISASASLPLVYLTEKNKPSPLTAPNFCMVLRKHLANAKILEITQPGLERIIHFKLEHYNEMGDLCQKFLIVELMGKHSNIIFTEPDGKIIDSIKHISGNISSVREVLPGRTYFIPDTSHKENPLEISEDDFRSLINSRPMGSAKAIYTSLTGISPAAAQDMCFLAGIDGDKPANVLDASETEQLYKVFSKIMDIVKTHSYHPNIIFKNGIPEEFSAYPLSTYGADFEIQHFTSMSLLLENYYGKKNEVTRIRQKSVDLRKIVQTILEKDYKKYDIQEKQLKDTQKRDTYQIYGELLTAYAYQLPEGEKSAKVFNYYTNEEITIPMNPELSPLENAKKFFEKYGKLKRTYEALHTIITETKEEIAHLESLVNALDIAVTEDDLKEIKEECIQAGYIRRKSTDKKAKYKSRPFHYLSSDGFHIYVGKNNLQNEELTFKTANGGDWWFHSKTFPGSHVIVKTEGKELPDRTFEEAARLAAYYSKGKGQEKVEIDYIMRKHVKKVAGAKPGFVIYHTNYSMAIAPDIEGIQEVL
jgi:predicted ribosome quality control (RQC) complex YloA/Tae2 family protein